MSQWYTYSYCQSYINTDQPILISQRSYAPGSSERASLEVALARMQKDAPFEVPCIINGKEVFLISYDALRV